MQFDEDSVYKLVGTDIVWADQIFETLNRALRITGPSSPKCGVDSYGWICLDRLVTVFLAEDGEQEALEFLPSTLNMEMTFMKPQ